MKLSQFIAKVFGWVQDNITEILTVLYDTILKAYLNDIWDVVVEEVEAVGGFVDLTDEEKRRRAFNAIKERVKVASIDVKDSAINLAIEMAVSYLKKLNR